MDLFSMDKLMDTMSCKCRWREGGREGGRVGELMHSVFYVHVYDM